VAHLPRSEDWPETAPLPSLPRRWKPGAVRVSIMDVENARRLGRARSETWINPEWVYHVGFRRHALTRRHGSCACGDLRPGSSEDRSTGARSTIPVAGSTLARSSDHSRPRQAELTSGRGDSGQIIAKQSWTGRLHTSAAAAIAAFAEPAAELAA